jgi:hypothetical protein
VRRIFRFFLILFGITIFPAVAYATFHIEAESADILAAPFQILNNAAASGGRLIVKPADQKRQGRANKEAQGKAVFTIDITSAGEYVLKARVYAGNSRSNSFIVQVDGGPKVIWNLPVSDVWQIVTFPHTLNLEAGKRTLTVFSDKPDTGLDRIEIERLTGAVSSEPTPQPAPQPTPHPDPAPAPPPPLSPSRDNLVSNPGFENGLTGWNAYGSFAVITSGSRSGTNAFRLNAGGGGAEQDVTKQLAVGANYNLDAYVRQAADGGQGFIGIKFLNSAGARISQFSTSGTSSSYERLTVNFTVPQDTGRAIIFAWKNVGSTYADYDDFELIATANAAPAPIVDPSENSRGRGLWVWSSAQVLGSSAEINRLVEESVVADVTDVYLFLVADNYIKKMADIRYFIGQLSRVGIRAWGLEGYRGYFSDAHGPSNLYKAVDNLIAYNSKVNIDERFFGFHSDMEPQDGQGGGYPNTFHNDLPDSKLNRSGGGVWYSSQSQDREMLMRDWLTIHSVIKNVTSDNGLRFGASMPGWTDNYYGEEIACTFNGVRRGVMKHMMDIVDEYAVMSYNTNPVNAANRVIGELEYADTLAPDRRPRVFAGVETHQNVGATISYGDHATKNSKSAVLIDIEEIDSLLGKYKSYEGTNIHDWVGWRALKP